MKIEFFKGKDKQWYWRAVAKNGQVVAIGGEGYTRRNTCKRGFARFCDHIIPAYFNIVNQ